MHQSLKKMHKNHPFFIVSIHDPIDHFCCFVIPRSLDKSQWKSLDKAWIKASEKSARSAVTDHCLSRQKLLRFIFGRKMASSKSFYLQKEWWLLQKAFSKEWRLLPTETLCSLLPRWSPNSTDLYFWYKRHSRAICSLLPRTTTTTTTKRMTTSSNWGNLLPAAKMGEVETDRDRDDRWSPLISDSISLILTFLKKF